MAEQDLVKIYHRMPAFLKKFAKNNEQWILKIYFFLFTIIGKLLNPIRLLKNKTRKNRKLEIGPAFGRLKGFETINIVGGLNVDYVYDASKRLPFKDDTFEVVYASHILEHLPWYETKQVLKEWIRVIKKGGNLELWVPDGFKIAKTIVDTEKNKNHSLPDKWIRFNDEKSPYIWANGRVFYGLNGDYPSWHKSLFTPKYLKTILESLGLKEIHVMDEEEYRNNKRGWINLGIKGTKK